MSTVLGANGLKEVYMKLASFGAVQISVTPTAENPEILNVDIGAEHRKEAMNMMTNKDETVDQFCQRIRSMMRALWNAEPRAVTHAIPAVAPKEVKKNQTWEEQKTEMKNKAEAPAPKAEVKK